MNPVSLWKLPDQNIEWLKSMKCVARLRVVHNFQCFSAMKIYFVSKEWFLSIPGHIPSRTSHPWLHSEWNGIFPSIHGAYKNKWKLVTLFSLVLAQESSYLEFSGEKIWLNKGVPHYQSSLSIEWKLHIKCLISRFTRYSKKMMYYESWF